MERTIEHLEGNQSAARPTEVARRAVLRRGAKLVYVVPAVLAALRATPAHAAVSSAVREDDF